MTQQQLNGAHVGPGFHQMSCKTVSKAMGCYRFGNAATSMGLLAGVLDRNPGDVAVDSITRNGKNWIHIGSKEAGPRVAAIVSIVETCRRLNIPIRDYLISILPGLADRPISQTAELTPAAWAKRNTSATPPTSSGV
jgi:hypothetical protein